MNTIFWISRHDLTEQQKQALLALYGDFYVIQINKDLDKKSVEELANRILATPEVKAVVGVLPPVLKADMIFYLNSCSRNIPYLEAKNKAVRSMNNDFSIKLDKNMFEIMQEYCNGNIEHVETIKEYLLSAKKEYKQDFVFDKFVRITKFDIVEEDL